MFHLAAAYYNLKEFDKAIDAYSQVIKTSRDHELLWRSIYQRSWAYYHSGREKEAINGFVDCLNRVSGMPISADIRFWLGQYYLQKEKPDKARVYFMQILSGKVQPELKDDALYQLGICYMRIGNYKAAIKEFRSLERRFPSSEFIPEGSLKTAQMQIKMKKNDRAKAQLRHLRSRFPQTVYESIALIKLAELSEQEKNYQRALFYLKSALRSSALVDEFKAQIYFELGKVWSEMNRDEQALDAYLKVVYLYPHYKELAGKAYMGAAKIYENNKEYEKAENIYEKIIDGQFSEEETARERLKWIEENSGE